MGRNTALLTSARVDSLLRLRSSVRHIVRPAVTEVTDPAAWAAREPAVANLHTHLPVPSSGKRPRAEQRKGPGAAVLLLALPLLCCGGPAIVAALAAASTATLGAVGGAAAALLVALAAGLRLRRRRRPSACCAPTGWRS